MECYTIAVIIVTLPQNVKCDFMKVGVSFVIVILFNYIHHILYYYEYLFYMNNT
jgi:hypothetical protein